MVYRHKSQEELPEQDTVIWKCTSEGCKGWMRDEFAFEHTPTCSLCSSPMMKTNKMLPQLINTSTTFKPAARKGASADSEG